MSASTQAVFLSYASQDAEAARRICDALRAAGVEVWFDQAELRGGDAWDAKIRKQIRECALFVPIISANTQARLEGYFRLEWKLAEDRSHLIAKTKAFIVPVVIDGTSEREAQVPETFLGVQWTLLRPAGFAGQALDEEILGAFAKRVGQLLTRSETLAGGNVTPGSDHRGVGAPRLQTKSSHRWLITAAAIVICLIGVGFWFTRVPVAPPPSPNPTPAAAGAASAAPVSEARKLARQAQTIIGIGEEVDVGAAELLAERALKLDDTDAEVWAAASAVDSTYLNFGITTKGDHVRNARERALKALTFDRGLYEARQAWAHYLIKDYSVAGGRVAAATEAVPILQQLRRERPRDPRTLLLLGEALLILRRVDEANEVHASLDTVLGSAGSGGWHYYQNGFFREADAALDRAVATKPLVAEVGLKIFFALTLYGDLDMATATLARIPVDQRRTPQSVMVAVMVHVWRRDAARILALLEPMAGEWIVWGLDGPVDVLIGDALALLGRREAAVLSWQQALKQIDTRLATRPTDKNLVGWQLYLQEALGDVAGFARTKRLYDELPNTSGGSLFQYERRSRIQSADDMLTQLERAVATSSRSPWASPYALRLNPMFDKVRDTPRFQAAIARSEENARANTLLLGGALNADGGGQKAVVK
jgi:tetratricopeptide (TPR) repeat protein